MRVNLREGRVCVVEGLGGFNCWLATVFGRVEPAGRQGAIVARAPEQKNDMRDIHTQKQKKYRCVSLREGQTSVVEGLGC